jgi:hypothetical protein
MCIFARIRRIWNMGKEMDDLKEAMTLMGSAVEEGVDEIKKLADQLAVCAATPMVPEDAATLNEVATSLRAMAERLHGAVYPPSSYVPPEPHDDDMTGGA